MEAPSVEAERRSGAARRRGRSRIIRRVMRRLVAILVVLALLPLGLTLLYRVPWVHPVSTLMIGDLVTLSGYQRQWTPLDQLGTPIVHAVMMSEDGQFCSHSGIDLGELKAAIDEALSGERARGASTIPMQTVKNLFLWPSRSFLRKGVEAPLALYLDAVMPKRRIMEIYLNIAEWGPGIYGAEAAAQFYFGRPAKDLSPRQAALLAAALPNPFLRNPLNPDAGARRVVGVIEVRARRAGAYDDCLE
ncbi:monofunctional biosynthetic peptidoglycan transglycosylase [Chelativorans sp. AA-79]|uniref:monofunctional biosynthetic peptidoglycan transglycosylase n=1 Tax=Chelativorans sp. AA-79 TaxID=3028735 RepID=UPI0023F6945A|nr:monofunctional biosynthetic peptidoglycan transglycosylase [Chelativorans sp. AA-79]WEX09842.1 monofunctional biosynthetic peptidoglycan transglycosylase [Chelativorans sp. AA-79]